MGLYARAGKRVVDVVVSLVAIAVTSPVMAAVAVAIYLDDGPPAIFAQRRVGRRGEAITVRKFRSMPRDTPDVPSAVAGDAPLTRVGRVIRRLSLDELPQLFSVLAGEMSLIGPRPALPAQQSLVAERAARGVLECRPGMTGLAQVRSYDGMPESEKVDHDAEYAAHVSLRGDLAVAFATFRYLTKPPPVY